MPYYSSKKLLMPLVGAPEPKRRFTPSVHEERKVLQLVRKIRAGEITFQKKKVDTTETYLMWTQDDDVRASERASEREPHPTAKATNPPPPHAPSAQRAHARAPLPWLPCRASTQAISALRGSFAGCFDSIPFHSIPFHSNRRRCGRGCGVLL